MAKLKSTQIVGTLQVQGEILNKATTSAQGVVQLSDATNSTSTTLAATANAVKKAYDLANGKANASHGNHVPATETANNARFLRNDNTWQTVTAANIGALASNGTATAASKLATARSIALGNQMSGSANFDGSGNITINAKINYIGISSGDLNTYVNDGWYRCATQGASNNVTNKPINTTDSINGFTLQVQRMRNNGDADSTVKQIFRWGTQVWERTGTMGSTTTWTAWREIAFTDSSITGNAATATKLQTVRTINGTNFDGTGNITTANWGTARTITIGSTGKSVNGSGNVSWSLSEIGAAEVSHTHNYAGSSSAGGAANSANKLATARTIAVSGDMIGSGSFDGSANLTITSTIRNVTINNTFATAFRTQTKGNTSAGAYISVVRNDTSGVASSPQYGSGLAFGRGDTHGYFYVNYSSAEAYIGGGNADKLSWTKRLAFTDSSITGNAATATKLQTARTIALTGGATGSGSFDGSGNLSIATTVSWNNIANKPTIPGVIMGSGKFTAGSTTTINLGTTIAVANYHVTVTPIGNHDGSLGEVYVTDKTTTSFKVGATGSTTGSFEYLVTYK